MAQTEDITGDVDPFAIEDEPSRLPDPDLERKSILVEISIELADDIAFNNSFEAVQLPANATPKQKVAAFDQIAIHKGLALHLTKYKIMIDNKIKELSE